VVRTEQLDILQDYISDGEHSVLFSTHITTDLEKVADFITFLYRGKLIFTKNKDDVLSDFRMLKGKPNDLADELKKSMIGLRENQMGFEGLVRTIDLASLPAGIITGDPTLEEIVVYHTMGVKQ